MGRGVALGDPWRALPARDSVWFFVKHVDVIGTSKGLAKSDNSHEAWSNHPFPR